MRLESASIVLTRVDSTTGHVYLIILFFNLSRPISLLSDSVSYKEREKGGEESERESEERRGERVKGGGEQV